MERKVVEVFNKGMRRDTSISKNSNEFAFHNQNIRITAREDNTLLSATNEKGNTEITFKNNALIEGSYLGHCVIGNFLILFTTDSTLDRIYRIEIEDSEFILNKLYEGFLNFNINNPIETLADFESDNSQKVYWVDGLNQPRVINIKTDYYNNDKSFDFLPSYGENLKLDVTREVGNSYFNAGTIQYFISYYTKEGQETKIVKASDLSYSSFEDRGASPEEITNSVFKITLSNIDTSFDYLRIYSIFRSSYNGEVIAKVLKDIKIESTSVSYIDNNTQGFIIDPKQLLFIGGDDIIAETINAKDGTLFLGNIKINDLTLSSEDQKTIKELLEDKFKSTYRHLPAPNEEGYYPYENQLKYSSSKIKTFKGGETYRFGIQFKTSKGVWSEPVFITDYKNDLYSTIQDSNINLPQVELELDLNNEALKNITKKYVSARLVYVEPDFSKRHVVAQGVINPTLFNVKERRENKPWSTASWFMRCFPGNVNSHRKELPEFRHYQPLYSNKDHRGEIQLTEHSLPCYTTSIENTGKEVVLLYQIDNNGTIIITYGYVSEDAPSDYDFFIKDAFKHDVVYMYQYDIASDDIFKQSINAATNIPILRIPTYNEILEGGRIGVVLKYPEYEKSEIVATSEEIESRNTQYYIDWETVTFNSPDVNENSLHLDNNLYKFRIIGLIPITSSIKDFDIKASSQIYNYGGTINLNLNTTFDLWDTNLNKDLISYPLWADAYWEKTKGVWNVDKSIGTLYAIYPWHKSGSINGQNSINTGSLAEDLPQSSSVLTNKIIVNKRISYSTIYLDSFWEAEDIQDPNKTGISAVRLFNTSEQIGYRLPKTNENKEYTTYFGNYNKIVTPSNPYSIQTVGKWVSNALLDYTENDYMPLEDILCEDSCIINYKSSPHLVFSLNKANNYTRIIPTIYHEDNAELEFNDPSLLYLWEHNVLDSTNIGNLKYIKNWGETITAEEEAQILEGDYIIWNNYINEGFSLLSKKTNANGNWPNGYTSTITNIILSYNNEYYYYNYDKGKLTRYNKISQDKLDIQDDINLNKSFIYLGELYTTDNLYGDTTEDHLKTHTWLPIGEEVYFGEDRYITIIGTEGDTYYQRWDCVKTLPDKGENSILDITSFMVESRINLDGRYDNFRQSQDLASIDVNKLNQINNVYSQTNNYLSYFILDKKFENSSYSNQFVWSLNKAPNAEIDAWTNVNTASSYALEGNKGALTSIQKFNNNLIAFQQKAISQILFNSRTQLATTEGTPIEIANSNKVDGVRYISENVGCNNKWSITTTPYGIYFIDDYNASINIFNGNLESLSNKSGFNIWTKQNVSNKVWSPATFDNFKTSYDSLNKDVYFINKNTCLVYSELLGEFTSFMDYNNVPMLTFFENSVIAFKDSKLWEQNSGEYNYFFNVFKPYFMEYKITPNPYSDKIYSNIEYRSDMWHNNTLLNDNTFDLLEVSNEYQSGTTLLKATGTYPNFEKKFRIWRTDIPRDQANNRDRIRNPWIKLKLKKNDVNTQRMEFHNLLVYYYE